MNLVFCMAGVYRRFREAGYTTPKFLLPWDGRPVMAHIIEHMYDSAAFADAVFVANQRDRGHEGEVHAVLAGFGIPADRLVFVGDTRGQAETALLGLDHLEKLGAAGAAPVLFHNIDTVLMGRDFRAIARALAECDGYIDSFDNDSPAYSYVRAGADGVVTEMAEKVVISRHATTGLYGFASGDLYRRWASQAATIGEFYISDVYKAMLAAGLTIKTNTDSAGHRTVIIGTPAEYQSVVSRPVAASEGR